MGDVNSLGIVMLFSFIVYITALVIIFSFITFNALHTKKKGKKVLKNKTIIWHPESSYVAQDLITGKNCVIGANQHIDSDVKMGDNCRIQGNCYIPPLTRIGNNVKIYPSVTICNDPMPPSKEMKGVTIGDNAQIFAKSVINGGVTIGSGAIIGMGSVVVKDVPANEVWFGNPARKKYGVSEYWEKKYGDKDESDK